MRFNWSACLLIFAIGSSGCFTQPTLEELENLFENSPYPTVVARYDPLNAILPYPTNLVFSGTADGTINIPAANPDDYSDPFVVLNSLDGFSTIQPLTFTFSGIVDQSTIIAGDTVRVFEVDLCCGQTNFLNALSVTRELEAPSALFGTPGEYTLSSFITEDAEGTAIDGVAITPTIPLKPATGYMVAVTRNVTDLNGVPIGWDLLYGISKRKTPLLDADGKSTINYALSDDQASALEALRSLNTTYEEAIEPFGIAADNVALTWAFTTQSTTNMLQSVSDAMSAGDYTMGPVFDPTTGAFQDSLDLALPGATGESYVFLGTVEVPYYLDPNAPSTGFWIGYQGNFATRIYEEVTGGWGPEQKNSEVIPFVATIPKNCGPAPAEGWPVSIFIHTMTQNRLNLFAIGDSMAQAPYCTAGIAIDLPLHGVDMYKYDAAGAATDEFSDTFLLSADAPQVFGADANEDGIPDQLGAYQNYPWFYSVRDTVHERHFNMDYDGDGKPDSAALGTQYFNPLSLLTTRDNIRQAQADVSALATTIPTMRNTWDGTLYGLSVLTETQKMAPSSNAACGEVSASDICNFSPLPCCGAIREAYDGVMALMGVAFLADQSVIGGSVGATADALTAAGAGALSLVTTSIEPAPGTIVPTSGLIYEAIRAAALAQMISTEFNMAGTNGYLTTCGTNAPSAAEVIGVVGATLDFARGADGANVADGYINPIAGSIDAFTVPDMSSADLAVGGRFENIAAATTGLEAVTAANDYLAAALGAVQTAVLGTGNSDGLADLAAAVAAADDQVVTDMAMLGEKSSALAPLVRGPHAAMVGLSTGDGNLSSDVLATLTTAAATVGAMADAAEAVEASAASPANLALAAVAKEAEVTAAGDVVGLASQGFVAAAEAYGAAATDAGAKTLAFVETGCGADLTAAGEFAAAVDAVAPAFISMVTAAGNTAGAVALMADVVVNLENTADTNTLLGLSTVALLQAIGTGPTEDLPTQPLGIAAAAGAGAGAIAEAANAITAATNTWTSTASVFDGEKISAIGHSFGGSVALPAAAVNSSIKQVVMIGPGGGLAYAFENSGSLGQALEDGLGGAGVVKGSALWESFFSVFQAAMDPADPLSYVDSLDSDQSLLVIEVERDQFFPNSVASRPLAGSSPLIDLAGLQRITATTDVGAGGTLRAAIRINADDAPVGFITYLDPTAGCGANDLACIEENDFYRQEMRNQTMSFISSGGTKVDINPIAPKYGGAIVEEAN